jgi:hypothetical protein
MERKPWEPGVAVKAEMFGGVLYVEARYLQECVAEIARLKEELAGATEYQKTQYLTASEREKLQAVLNASIRQVLDAMPNNQGKGLATTDSDKGDEA